MPGYLSAMRGRAMAEAARARPGGMAMVRGFKAQAREVVEHAAKAGAIFDAGQITGDAHLVAADRARVASRRFAGRSLSAPSFRAVAFPTHGARRCRAPTRRRVGHRGCARNDYVGEQRDGRARRQPTRNEPASCCFPSSPDP